MVADTYFYEKMKVNGKGEFSPKLSRTELSTWTYLLGYSSFRVYY